MSSLLNDGPFARDLAQLRERYLRINPPPPAPRPPSRIEVYRQLVAEAKALGIRNVKQRRGFDSRREAARLIGALQAQIEARRAKLFGAMRG